MESKDKQKLTLLVFAAMVCVVLLWVFVFLPKSREKIARKSFPTLGQAIEEITKPTEGELKEQETEARKQEVEKLRQQEADEFKDVPRLPVEEPSEALKEDEKKE